MEPKEGNQYPGSHSVQAALQRQNSRCRGPEVPRLLEPMGQQLGQFCVPYTGDSWGPCHADAPHAERSARFAKPARAPQPPWRWFSSASVLSRERLAWPPFPAGRERAFSPSYCVLGSSDPRNSPVTALLSTCLPRECSKRAYPLLSFVPKSQEAGSVTWMKRWRLGKAGQEPGSVHSAWSLQSPAFRHSPWPWGSGPGWRLGPSDRREGAGARAPGQRGMAETQG